MVTPRDPAQRRSLEVDPGEEDEPVVPEPLVDELSGDPEVPEADALEQAEEVAPGSRVVALPRDPEVPEADAWEQSLEVPYDDDEDIV
ncbi:MAG: hypothetical protein C0P77_010105 [Thermoanaerobacterales bacterium]|jgi:hypothetical protein|nr:hypothetical protein [Thermoanaerobacterales bacterium]